jgi:hypothetical protein
VLALPLIDMTSMQANILPDQDKRVASYEMTLWGIIVFKIERKIDLSPCVPAGEGKADGKWTSQFS